MTGISHLIISILLSSAGKMTDSVICKADPAQSYALYVPARGDRAALPVIFFFDPHANGALPLRKYRTLADTYGFILAGSNNSRNGNDGATSERIWRRLSEDIRGRVKIDPNRIYACGFSGGAKVAGYLAIQHPEIAGVIAGGAGLPDGTPAASFPFSLTAIAGEGDMNLTELVSLNDALDKTRTPHRIIFFDGKHEWAPVSTMDLAFAGLQFDVMKRGGMSKDQAFIDRYMVKSRQRLNTYITGHRLLRAMQEYRISISLLDGLTDQVRWFKDRAFSLDKNPGYRQERQVQETLLSREEATKGDYGRHFQQEDRTYWATTIRDLQIKSTAGTAESAMYQRLLAYLSLAFYSISHQLIAGNENKEARYFVELYKMADPANSEAWYFSAVLHARDRDGQAAEGDLLRAAGEGFNDKVRMRQQPEFNLLSGKIDFLKVERKMRSGIFH